MDTAKTLAARPDELASFLRTLARHYEGPASEKIGAAADYLDRLSAPNVGVGLTRYTIKTTNDKNGFPVIDPYKDYAGPWVRFEDIATLIAAARAVPAGVKPFGYFCEHRLADPVFLRPPSYIPEPGPNSKVTPLYTAAALAASTARADMLFAEGMVLQKALKESLASRDESRAEVAASTAREKAKDAEIAGLREARERATAQAVILREAHEKCNGALRSTMAIADREGRATNWPAFRATIRESLDLSHMVLNALADADKAAALSGRKPDTKEGT